MVRDGVREVHASSLRTEFDGDGALQRGARGFCFDRSSKHRTIRVGLDFDWTIVREVRAFDLRPDPKPMPTVKAEITTSSDPGLAVEFVKLVLAARQGGK